MKPNRGACPWESVRLSRAPDSRLSGVLDRERTSTGRWRRVGANGLILLGMICLGVWGATLLEARWTEMAIRWRVEARRLELAGSASAHPAADEEPGRQSAPEAGAFVAELSIPRLGLKAVVLEGVESGVLRKAVGHFPGTALPGEPGNVAFAGHRDTFFRQLRHVEPGDRVVVAPVEGELEYEVTGTEVVEPTAIEVLRSRHRDELTLVTCYPFGYVGPAPRRFVVRARLIERRPSAARPGVSVGLRLRRLSAASPGAGPAGERGP